MVSSMLRPESIMQWRLLDMETLDKRYETYGKVRILRRGDRNGRRRRSVIWRTLAKKEGVENEGKHPSDESETRWYTRRVIEPNQSSEVFARSGTGHLNTQATENPGQLRPRAMVLQPDPHMMIRICNITTVNCRRTPDRRK